MRDEFHKKFASVGDVADYKKDGFRIVAQLVHDSDTKPTDYDCYSDKEIAAWEKDKWCFVGMVLDVWHGDVRLCHNAASLWGIAINMGEDDSHLNEILDDLESQALAQAREELARLRAVEITKGAIVASKTLDRMKEYGGSFAARLAGLYIVADEGNRARLVSEFSDVFGKYSSEDWDRTECVPSQ